MRRFLVDPPGGRQNGTTREFDIIEQAEEYAARCPPHTRIVDRELTKVDSVSSLLEERGKTHGAFVVHARITQRLKAVIYDEIEERLNRGQPTLQTWQVESLDMISHKIGRIIAGDANFPDHWEDIAGYAMLPLRCKLDDETLTTTFGPVELYTVETGGYPLDEDLAAIKRNQGCQLEGRNCPPDHEHPAFGEGDETSREHIHRWVVTGDIMNCAVSDCAETRPIVDQKPDMYAIDLDRKFPCHCWDMDRCKIENNHPIGNNVYCCKAEAGK